MSLVNFVWACGSNKSEFVTRYHSDGSKTVEEILHDGECRYTKMQRHTLLDLVQLGITFGWQPQGAAIEDRVSKINRWLLPDEDSLSSYDPAKYSDFKLVGREDAVHWAGALEQAAAAIESGSYAFTPTQGERTFSDCMTPSDFFKVNQTANTGHIRSFAEFLKKGPFLFFYDD